MHTTARLRTVPVTGWRYNVEGGGIRHIGPMAQDGERASGVSCDSLTVKTADFDGVHLAAVQAPKRRTASLLEKNRALAERVRRLDAVIESLAKP
jgi:hypothetical protein